MNRHFFGLFIFLPFLKFFARPNPVFFYFEFEAALVQRGQLLGRLMGETKSGRNGGVIVFETLANIRRLGQDRGRTTQPFSRALGEPVEIDLLVASEEARMRAARMASRTIKVKAALCAATTWVDFEDGEWRQPFGV